MKKYFYFPLLLLFITIAKAQQPNDCVNAITISASGVFNSNASGAGNVQEVIACGPGREHNSIWLKIVIGQAGTLGFDLIPKNPDLLNGDYDFWVYGPNRTCGTGLGSAIRCNVTNPLEANLPNNITGMNGSTNSISAWSGTGGNNLAYVKWLTVAVGEIYYIAIDRPYDTEGFELHWTGSAALVPGPIANPTSDYTIVSDATPNVGLFNLGVKRSEINSDWIANSVDFFTTLANAVDYVSPLPNIYANTSNPQTIYARVTNKTTGYFSLSQFNLVVSTTTLSVNLDSANGYSVTANPNPFKENFKLDLTTSNQETVGVFVYDMLGKLIDERQILPNAVSDWQIGGKYPSGIYNIVVSQGDKTKTLRIIKK
ncbi:MULTISPECIES: T9SS type A sorting domain-containing protein [Flavobacterium]|uniref:T9SS type A sorting domain-containing protein n=1 Tax=Flavobacterium TaxID=237 RepID=UPI001FCAC9FF|nr:MULTISPECIES: T9SS type A sorting domain-containing protein [Flavobacterium]UOK43553.1 T9SS type A sorting domain-containing protein [Flavobacterium enshiense]